MEPSYDVVVVGARVGGASTALLLARAGLRVALLDRGSYGSDTLSTHGLMRAGVLQLSRWGVLPAVVRAGTPPVQRTTFHYSDGDSVQVTIRPSAGVDSLFAPRRHLLDRILVDAAAAAGAEVHHGVRVTDVERGRDGRAAGVRILDPRGRSATLRSRFVVGADGIRSTVADALGAVVERRTAPGGAVLFRYHAELPATGYEWAYGPGVASGMLPTNDGLTCVFVGTTRERMRLARRAGTAAAFEGLFAVAAEEHLPRLQASVPEGKMFGWNAVPGFVRRSWGPGWALVGDAGYFKDPITAHGMTDALRDAELLADAIVASCSGLQDEESALASYQARRDELSRRLFTVTHQIAAYDWDMDSIRRLLREASAAMTDEVEHLEDRRTLPGAGSPAGLLDQDTVLVRE